MELKVKWKGKLLMVEMVNEPLSVDNLKKKIETQTKIEAKNQKLMVKGKKLEVRMLSILTLIYLV